MGMFMSSSSNLAASIMHPLAMISQAESEISLSIVEEKTLSSNLTASCFVNSDCFTLLPIAKIF